MARVLGLKRYGFLRTSMKLITGAVASVGGDALGTSSRAQRAADRDVLELENDRLVSAFRQLRDIAVLPDDVALQLDVEDALTRRVAGRGPETQANVVQTFRTVRPRHR